MLKGLGLQEDPYTAKYENIGCIETYRLYKTYRGKLLCKSMK
jgi:hypothetical protein